MAACKMRRASQAGALGLGFRRGERREVGAETDGTDWSVRVMSEAGLHAQNKTKKVAAFSLVGVSVAERKDALKFLRVRQQPFERKPIDIVH